LIFVESIDVAAASRARAADSFADASSAATADARPAASSPPSDAAAALFSVMNSAADDRSSSRTGGSMLDIARYPLTRFHTDSW
jgi:hypothetical protein